jgi:hypothetical protein
MLRLSLSQTSYTSGALAVLCFIAPRTRCLALGGPGDFLVWRRQRPFSIAGDRLPLLLRALHGSLRRIRNLFCRGLILRLVPIMLTTTCRKPFRANRHGSANRRLRADRGLQDGGFGRLGRLNRLVVLASVRFGRVLCRPARDSRQRPMAHCFKASAARGKTAVSSRHPRPRNRIPDRHRLCSRYRFHASGGRHRRGADRGGSARGEWLFIPSWWCASTTGQPCHGSADPMMARPARLLGRRVWSCEPQPRFTVTTSKRG